MILIRVQRAGADLISGQTTHARPKTDNLEHKPTSKIVSLATLKMLN